MGINKTTGSEELKKKSRKHSGNSVKCQGQTPVLTSTGVPNWPMIKKYLKRLIITNKEAILMEVLSIRGLRRLLMKIRNTDEKWTREEKEEIKRHLRNIAKIIPAVAIFSLPGGSFLLPILAEALDRRKTRRL